MSYIVIDDQNEVNKILNEQLNWYKEELKKAHEGYKYADLFEKFKRIFNSYENDEDYDEFVAISDFKYFMQQFIGK